MIKTLARSIREYKKASILTPLLVTVEVIMECVDPLRDRKPGQSDAGRLLDGRHRHATAWR